MPSDAVKKLSKSDLLKKSHNACRQSERLREIARLTCQQADETIRAIQSFSRGSLNPERSKVISPQSKDSPARKPQPPSGEHPQREKIREAVDEAARLYKQTEQLQKKRDELRETVQELKQRLRETPSRVEETQPSVESAPEKTVSTSYDRIAPTLGQFPCEFLLCSDNCCNASTSRVYSHCTLVIPAAVEGAMLPNAPKKPPSAASVLHDACRNSRQKALLLREVARLRCEALIDILRVRKTDTGNRKAKANS